MEIAIVPPPFTEFRSASETPDHLATWLPLGTVLLLRIRGGDASGPLRDLVRDIRFRRPDCPVAAWITCDDPSVAARCAWAASGATVSAIVTGEHPDARSLRAQLTNFHSAVTRARDWISGFVRTAAGRRDIIAAALEMGHEQPTLPAFARAMACSARTVRRKAGPFTPKELLALGRVLHTLLLLQSRSGLSIMTGALRSGYSDVSVLYRQCSGLFGTKPAELRALLGPEPLLYIWARKRGVLRHGRNGQPRPPTPLKKESWGRIVKVTRGH